MSSSSNPEMHIAIVHLEEHKSRVLMVDMLRCLRFVLVQLIFIEAAKFWYELFPSYEQLRLYIPKKTAEMTPSSI
jgi:hypothetical protein